ncbi:disease resistance protein RUN1-like [Lactuca sativa]|nr:disease resistance protein RUN1-like [Lactuca sativa]
MASSSSSRSALAFSSQPWKYHVFLSFRGEDTRKTFVDHLYTALEQQGIHTYKDDETLPRGESIGPSLEKAIEESQISVIIFSKNYVDSSWCLDELAYIMKCKDRKGQIVMPIFYDVEPSIVRKQKQIYGEAFSKHELENNKKVESWRKALVDASSISGWEIKLMANGHESKGIKEIVDTISHRLCPLTSSANENYIGIEARMKDLKSKLEIGSGGVRMIGIWGVGGGGKTTLALSIYSEISSQFDGFCFVENIREESSRYGLEKLQKKILSDVLKKTEMEVNKVGGKWLPDDRLRRINVLIVLDDVDHHDQLKALAGSHNWFGEGSRIIITTRDEHVLTAHKVDVIHNITLLSDDEAMNLFCKLAPQEYRSKEDYELLSKEVISYSGGLPLALTVLGCFLCDKDINTWRSVLARLKKIPETDIVEKLKISYDGLKPVEKELFLDIACFFRRRYKDERIMAMFDACGFYPGIGIRVLTEKALITISDGRFDMHDLVQEMGHYIVRGEHPNNPEKHTRVWKKEDVLKVFATNATEELDMIQAIRFECYSYGPVELLPPVVANMKNLRWVDWRGYYASPFPTNFPPRELCCLILDCYSQKQLWKGYKLLPNLKIMELYDLKKLITTPDFDRLPNLERFVLHGCRCLKEIHPSIGRLKGLVFLSIEFFPSLKIFPPITQLKELETLSLSYWHKLVKLLEIQQQNMDNLPQLHPDSSGKEVKKSSTNFSVTCWTCGDTEVKKPGEDLIDVEECCLEEPFSPHNNMKLHTVLWLFPRGLRKLDLWFCNLGDKEMGSAVWDLPNLEELNLAGNYFSRLNFSLLRLPRLKWLNVSGCENLVGLSELPSSIAVLRADWCTSLKSLGDISNCKWLWKVSLRGDNELGPLVSDILLDSVLQGNAIEHHFISVALAHQITPKRFVGRLFRRTTFTLDLPHDWQEVDQDSQSELWQESNNEALAPKYDETATFLGYVSFSSLRHTTSLNSSYNKISFSLDIRYEKSLYGKTYIGAELIPKEQKGDQVQTSCSEFWDGEGKYRDIFRIQNDSVKILWQPDNDTSQSGMEVVFKVNVQNAKEKREAMKAVSSVAGIRSIAMDMKHKKLTVIGVTNLVVIISKLRKRWDTKVLSAGPARGLWKLIGPTILS